MHYLLGELTPSEATIFEQRLESSPAKSDELLKQADLIANLSAASSYDSPMATALPCSPHSWLAKPAIATLVAVAACIALLVANIQPNAVSENSIAALGETSTNATEDLLIAQAWVDHQFDSISMNFALDDFEIDDLVTPPIDDLSDTDSTLSWMFIAVSDGSTILETDALEAESTNDG